jgi:hypothetical protein
LSTLTQAISRLTARQAPRIRAAAQTTVIAVNARINV